MDDNQITNILNTVLIILLPTLLILVTIWIILMIKTKKSESKAKTSDFEKQKINDNGKKTIKGYTKDSIYNFMDFEDIKDNLIIRKKGINYLMVMDCQGVNYDLMSGIEKTSTEAGFIQFLNTLRFPIQLYIQTRTVNLGKSLERYERRIDGIKREYTKKQISYNSIMNTEGYSEKQRKDAKLEYIKAKNLYEYGLDVLQDTARMNLNKNMLKKHYYLILSYFPEESDRGTYIEDEIRNEAFADLYTKALSLSNLLAATGVKAKVLNSTELAELLYISYNRDDSELLQLDKVLDSGYMEMYSTAKDVIEKRINEIDKEVERKAQELAEDAVEQAYINIDKREKLAEKESKFQEAIDILSAQIIEDNELIIGKEIAEESKEIIKKRKTIKKGEK